mmetsp:Transcript_27098/g.81722  ORF Transcript_27098/g.81722 Transcript_27098/m.81722 type:complete len:236 (+) Transcript_27098:69-776(+)
MHTPGTRNQASQQHALRGGLSWPEVPRAWRARGSRRAASQAVKARDQQLKQTTAAAVVAVNSHGGQGPQRTSSRTSSGRARKGEDVRIGGRHRRQRPAARRHLLGLGHLQMKRRERVARVAKVALVDDVKMAAPEVANGPVLVQPVQFLERRLKVAQNLICRSQACPHHIPYEPTQRTRLTAITHGLPSISRRHLERLHVRGERPDALVQGETRLPSLQVGPCAVSRRRAPPGRL